MVLRDGPEDKRDVSDELETEELAGVKVRTEGIETSAVSFLPRIRRR